MLSIFRFKYVSLLATSVRRVTSRVKLIFYEQTVRDIAATKLLYTRAKICVSKAMNVCPQDVLRSIVYRRLAALLPAGLVGLGITAAREQDRSTARMRMQKSVCRRITRIYSTILPLLLSRGWRRVSQLPNVRRGRLSALPENKPTAPVVPSFLTYFRNNGFLSIRRLFPTFRGMF